MSSSSFLTNSKNSLKISLMYLKKSKKPKRRLVYLSTCPKCLWTLTIFPNLDMINVMSVGKWEKLWFVWFVSNATVGSVMMNKNIAKSIKTTGYGLHLMVDIYMHKRTLTMKTNAFTLMRSRWNTIEERNKFTNWTRIN